MADAVDGVGLTPGAAVARGLKLVEQLTQGGVPVRLLGGIAIAARCASAQSPPLARPFHDIDVMTRRSDARTLSRKMAALGYKPHDRFNALHGRHRMMFTATDGLHVDVLVEEFRMCHELRVGERLSIDGETLSLADLLLTKLQIAKLNRKDATDLAALLIDHDLTDDETGLNAKYIASFLAGDWGWWRTTTDNLTVLDDLWPTLGLFEPEGSNGLQRLRRLAKAIDGAKKTLRWKSRARIGDRVAWRLEPEEVA